MDKEFNMFADFLAEMLLTYVGDTLKELEAVEQTEENSETIKCSS